MKKEIKVGIIVAIVEAIFALIVGYLLYLVQENTIEQKTVETLAGYFDEVEADMSYEQAMKQLIEDSLQKDVLINDLRQKEQELIEIKASLEIDENNSKIVESAQHYASTNDYEMALAVLRSVVSKTPQIFSLPYWTLVKVMNTSSWGLISNFWTDSSTIQYSSSNRPYSSPVSLAQ